MAEETWQSLLDSMQSENLTHVFCGHTHRPFIKEIGGYTICNIGSAGMPLDGDPRRSWVLWDEDSFLNPLLSIRRVEYDLSRTLQLIDQNPDYYDFKRPGFQAAYKQMFLTGIPWRFHIPDQTGP